MFSFEWTKKRVNVSLDLAEGYTLDEVADRNKITARSISRWKLDSEFVAEVNRLTMMLGIAAKAERMKIIKRVARQKMTGTIDTKKDLLEWLQFAQSETDGIKLDLTNLLAAFTENDRSLAGIGPDGEISKDADREPEAS